MEILSLSLNCSTVDTSCTKKEGEAESMTYIAKWGLIKNEGLPPRRKVDCLKKVILFIYITIHQEL